MSRRKIAQAPSVEIWDLPGSPVTTEIFSIPVDDPHVGLGVEHADGVTDEAGPQPVVVVEGDDVAPAPGREARYNPRSMVTGRSPR
jgi:hypothetical protein